MKLIAAAFFLAFVICVGCVSSSAAETTRPNILFILTDDQGWPTLGCYGSQQVPTPHLDRLADEGVRFTDAYVMPQCTPTRAALLTGQHTARSGMWHVIPWYGQPWARIQEPAFREQLPREWSTLPKVLRGHGYATGMAGKWHLTNGVDGNYVELKSADAYGFDFVAPRGPGSQNEGDKWVDHLTDSAISFIRERQERPWFFYLSHHTLHGVVSAPAELVKKYREAGAPETGMFNATYLAAIEHLDNSIGRLMAALDEMQQRENTIVVFLSDNGGLGTVFNVGSETLTINRQEFDNAPLRAGKGTPYEGGIRVPCMLRWPAKVAAGQTVSTPIHVTDWMPTLLAAAGCDEGESDYDGVNLIPLLQGERLLERPLFFHMPLYDLRWAATPCAVIREGDWKLIEYFGDSFDRDLHYLPGRKLELFNLRSDLGETTNLASMERVRADAMSAKLHAWLKSIPTPIPTENPHFDPKKQFDETKVKQPWNR
ncbi:sulfatase [Stieleria varia]|uniref:Arylsulfatase n=1 Tax=Stieleria varia TaxID=2528005 RepID=A0A5C6AY97_9BACT|nr:sulfatase [Stieleria varia]TWU04690.1 Arylsulfatase [Stieleria varia]